MADVDEPVADKGREGRQRSSISFPYNDLSSAIKLAQAIHNQVGLGECDDNQLAAWTSQSPKSSGYRVQLSASRMFQLLESPSPGKHRLSELGRMVVDPSRAREAKAKAFLNVPLYEAVFKKYSGTVLPPATALEHDMEALGVAEKMKDRARRVFERSAEQAGFFDSGRERLVLPGVATRSDDSGAQSDQEDEPDSNEGEKDKHRSDDAVDESLHPFIQGLLKTLPDPERQSEWPLALRVKWLQTAANIFDLLYEGEGGIEVRAESGKRSPYADEQG